MVAMNVTFPTFGPPTTLDIVLPPSLFIAVIVFSILLLSLLTQPKWWQSRCCPVSRLPQLREEVKVPKVYPPTKQGWCDFPQSPNLHQKCHSVDPLTASVPNNKDATAINGDSFFTSEDMDILKRMEEFQNNPVSLLCVCIPVIASLAFCPVTIITYGIWMDFFWPPEITGPMGNINDAIACFLMPAGLVYAIAFGFALQDVLAKRADVERALRDQRVLLQQTQDLLQCAEVVHAAAKRVVAYTMKDAVISWMAELLGRKKFCQKGHMWDAVNTLQQLQSPKQSNNGSKRVLDDTIVNSIFSNLLQLDSSLNYDLQKGNRSINFLQWLFLELLGFISFFGILMIKAGSYRLELTMCILTVFSISAFSYILADLDSSYHGVFRMNLMPTVEFLKTLNANTKPKSPLTLKH